MNKEEFAAIEKRHAEAEDYEGGVLGPGWDVLHVKAHEDRAQLIAEFRRGLGTVVDCPRDTLPTPALTQAQQNFRADLRKVLSEIETGLIEKNDAYGDSALNPVRCFARDLDTEAQIRVRMDDKLSRIMRGELKIGSDVAAEDVMRDLLGYLVLYRIAQLRKGKQ